MAPRHKTVLLTIGFEAGLGLAGAALAVWFAIPVASRFSLEPPTLMRCVWATAPMLALLVVAIRTRWKPLVDLRRFVESLVNEFFRDARWWELAAISIAAGVGEEMLFRGALQPLGERWLGPTAGLIAISVLFGVVHAASALYFALATAIGVYLGWLAQRYDDLVTPIFVHTAYDWAALLAMQRGRDENLDAT
jgi:membrane protease YdiL (CAAX protease family)